MLISIIQKNLVQFARMPNHPDLQSFISPVFVGRKAELKLLERALEQAKAGSGTMVLITGEAGIGKSRLAREIQTMAVKRGVEFVRGRCFEQDRTLPYAPCVDFLHRSNVAETFSEDPFVL